jgi:inorganic pyrophosphatase/manganese-dependent inorganic pyrophosphatase
MIWLPVVGDWADIDVYASTLAYADLLNQHGKPAKIYLPAAPNYSTPEALRIKHSENLQFDLAPTDEVIILDISMPKVISQLIPDNQIIELVDHHPGYEDYWRKRLGSKAIIEKIGAVATLVFERWGKSWDYDKMSPKIAKLLLAAILDNTLNFNAVITTARDHRAAKKLATIANVSIEDFTDWYFSTVAQAVMDNLENSLLGDAKDFHIPKLNLDILCGQLTLWRAEETLDREDVIRKTMNSKSENWLVNILSVSSKKNYIITNNSELSDYLSKLLALSSNSGWQISNQLYLRKEIFAKILGDK